MDDIITAISGLQGLVSLRGVSKEAIASAEQALGVSFAADYRAYLEKYGVISADSIEITGLAESKRLNVVDVTREARQRNPLPRDMYVIDDTGIEGILILQNSKGEVYEFQNRKSKKIHDSLSGFLRAEQQ